MSVQRTPPKFPSSPDIPNSCLVADNAYILRKRKQPDDEVSTLFEKLEKQFEDKLCLWNKKIDISIGESVSAAVKSCLSDELSKLTAALSDINTSIVSLRAETDSNKTAINAVNTVISDMQASLTNMDRRQDTLEEQVATLNTQTSTQRDVPAHVTALELKISHMEQQLRESNIELSNLPERRNEDLIAVVINLGAAVNLNLSAKHITSVHRVPHASREDSRPKNVVIKFCSRILRDNVLSACRLKKGITSEMLAVSGPSRTIYVNEHLTVTNKLLFREARHKAKSQDFKFVWVKHGVILARRTENSPVVAIRSVQDLDKIRP